MPAFTAVAAAVVTAIGVTGVAAAVTTFVVKTLAVSVVSNLLLKPKIPRIGGLSSVSSIPGNRVQLSPNTSNKLPVCYGRSWINGIIVDAKISTDQQYMWYVLAFSETTDGGQINFSDDVGEPLFYWGDKRLIFGGQNNTIVTAAVDDNGNEQQYDQDEFRVYCYRRGSSDPLYGAPTAVTVLSDATTGDGIPLDQRWTATDTMSNCSFVIIRLKYNQDKNLTGLQTLTTRITNTLTVPGSVIRDYLLNARYGCGIPPEQVDTDALDDLDTYSEELITYIQNGTTVTQQRYHINAPIDTSQNCLDILQQLCETCDSWLRWDEANGRWTVTINKSFAQMPDAQSPGNLRLITDDHIIGGIDIIPLDSAATYSRAEINFPNSLNRDQFGVAYIDLEDFPNIKVNPNEPDNSINLRYLYTNDSVQAQYLAYRKLLQSREDLIIEFNMDYSGIQIDAGDIICVRHDWYEWGEGEYGSEWVFAGKPFRVTRVQEVLSTDGILGSKITAVEYNDTIYDDNSVTAFVLSPNSNITNPSIISQPDAPVLGSADFTAAIPSFVANAIVPQQGSVIAMEFWWSTEQDILNNNYRLYSTQFYSGNGSAGIYPNGLGVSIRVSGLPPGDYYFRVRAVGPSGSASAFSPPSNPLQWRPNPTTSVTGQNFQAIFSPQIIQIPRDFNAVPNFNNINPTLYGILGGGTIEFVSAQSDSSGNFIENTWRIGASDTGGWGDVVQDNITLGALTDAGSYAVWDQPTAMTQEPAYLTVPVRFKDSTGTVYQAPPARLQFVFVDPGENGEQGLPAITTVTPRVYFAAPIASEVAVTGGTWDIGDGNWLTRPTTTVDGTPVPNSNVPISFALGEYRYVATPAPYFTVFQTGTFNPTWNTAPQIDAGYGPPGQNGENPVSIDFNLAATAFYRSSGGLYSPSSITITATTQNYPLPIPQGTWTVTGGTPLSGTGSTITVTPTSINSVEVRYQIGGYVKNITIPVVGQGEPGQAGTPGSQGPQGTRGFTPVAYIPTTFDPRPSEGATTAQLNTAWQAQIGYPPIVGDGGAFYFGTTSFAGRYNGSIWVTADLQIPGDLIVDGTIRSASLAVNDLYALNFTSTNAVATFGEFLRYTGYNTYSRINFLDTSVEILGDVTQQFTPGSTFVIGPSFKGLSFSVVSSAFIGGRTVVTFTPGSTDEIVAGALLYQSTPGTWINATAGDAHFNGDVHIGKNLYVDGLIDQGALRDGVVNRSTLAPGAVSSQLGEKYIVSAATLAQNDFDSSTGSSPVVYYDFLGYSKFVVPSYYIDFPALWPGWQMELSFTLNGTAPSNIGRVGWSAYLNGVGNPSNIFWNNTPGRSQSVASAQLNTSVGSWNNYNLSRTFTLPGGSTALADFTTDPTESNYIVLVFWFDNTGSTVIGWPDLEITNISLDVNYR